MIVAVVATSRASRAARETVRAVLAVDPDSRCEVLDLDGRYRPVGRERVRTPRRRGPSCSMRSASRTTTRRS